MKSSIAHLICENISDYSQLCLEDSAATDLIVGKLTLVKLSPPLPLHLDLTQMLFKSLHMEDVGALTELKVSNSTLQSIRFCANKAKLKTGELMPCNKFKVNA